MAEFKAENNQTPTSQEIILSAFADLLRSIPQLQVLRGEVLPERISPAGLVLVRDGTPESQDVTLSPLTYHFRHRAKLEVTVQWKTRRYKYL